MKQVLIGLIRIYQRTVSLDHGWLSNGTVRVCRFSPTCSEYMIDALTHHGVIKGLGLGIARITRCHPRHPGGLDPVPTPRLSLKKR